MSKTEIFDNLLHGKNGVGVVAVLLHGEIGVGEISDWGNQWLGKSVTGEVSVEEVAVGEISDWGS